MLSSDTIPRTTAACLPVLEEHLTKLGYEGWDADQLRQWIASRVGAARATEIKVGSVRNWAKEFARDYFGAGAVGRVPGTSPRGGAGKKKPQG